MQLHAIILAEKVSSFRKSTAEQCNDNEDTDNNA